MKSEGDTGPLCTGCAIWICKGPWCPISRVRRRHNSHDHMHGKSAQGVRVSLETKRRRGVLYTHLVCAHQLLTHRLAVLVDKCRTDHAAGLEPTTLHWTTGDGPRDVHACMHIHTHVCNNACSRSGLYTRFGLCECLRPERDIQMPHTHMIGNQFHTMQCGTCRVRSVDSPSATQCDPHPRPRTAGLGAFSGHTHVHCCRSRTSRRNTPNDQARERQDSKGPRRLTRSSSSLAEPAV